MDMADSCVAESANGLVKGAMSRSPADDRYTALLRAYLGILIGNEVRDASDLV